MEILIFPLISLWKRGKEGEKNKLPETTENYPSYSLFTLT